MLEVGRSNLKGPVMPSSQFVYARAIDIEADHRNTGARKRNRDRQANIAEADNRDFTSVCQWSSLPEPV